jgi:hypothetical protein
MDSESASTSSTPLLVIFTVVASTGCPAPLGPRGAAVRNAGAGTASAGRAEGAGAERVERVERGVAPALPDSLGPVPGLADTAAPRVAWTAAILRAAGAAGAVLRVGLPAGAETLASGRVAAFGSAALATARPVAFTAFGSAALATARPVAFAAGCMGDVAPGSSLMSTFSAAASRPARAVRRRLLVPAYSVRPS